MKKLELLLCLSFLPKVALDPIHIPFEVRRILKNRIQSQYQSEYSNRDIRFDDTSCAHLGTYEFRNESIQLTAAHAFWQGTQEYNLNNILDGVKLEFPSYKINETQDQKKYHSQDTQISLDSEYRSEKKKFNKWVWMGGIALASITTGIIVANANHASATPTLNTNGSAKTSIPTGPRPTSAPSPSSPGRGR